MVRRAAAAMMTLLFGVWLFVICNRRRIYVVCGWVKNESLWTIKKKVLFESENLCLQAIFLYASRTRSRGYIKGGFLILELRTLQNNMYIKQKLNMPATERKKHNDYGFLMVLLLWSDLFSFEI